MKRLIASLLACVMVLGTVAAIADADGDRIFCYDFDLQFHLNANLFSLHDRQMMQGYADLLEVLRFKGNIAWTKDGRFLDLHLELVPVQDPGAAIPIRVFGRRKNWLNVSSPALGEQAICFQPWTVMTFVVRAYQMFEINLFPAALLLPSLTIIPFEDMEWYWDYDVAYAGKMEDGAVIPAYIINVIANDWAQWIQEDANSMIKGWIRASTMAMPDSEEIAQEMRNVPELLRYVTCEKDLNVEAGNGYFRYRNADGEVLYERREDGTTTERELTLPKSNTNYTPYVYIRETKTEEENGWLLDLKWDRTTDDELLPESIIRVKAEAEHVPVEYPTDAEFNGNAVTEGVLVPNFNVILKGNTTAEGEINLSVTPVEKAADTPMLSVTGKLVPTAYAEETLYYYVGDIVTDINLFALDDRSLSVLKESLTPALTEVLPDFICALPASGIQSILDLLERYSILQTLIR